MANVKDWMPDFRRLPAELALAGAISMIGSALGTWWAAVQSNAPEITSVGWLVVFVALAFAILAFIAIGAWVIGWARRQWVPHKAPAPSVGLTQVATATVRDPPPLTADQRVFRIALKQFSLTHPQRLTDCIGAVRGVLVARIKELGDQDYSHALHRALHEAWSGGSRYLPTVISLASVESELIDVAKLQHQLRCFFSEYQQALGGIADLNALAKIDLRAAPAMRKLLDVDKEAASELAKLKVWPEAEGGVRKCAEGAMASNEAIWTTPTRINF